MVFFIHFLRAFKYICRFKNRNSVKGMGFECLGLGEWKAIINRPGKHGNQVQDMKICINC